MKISLAVVAGGLAVLTAMGPAVAGNNVAYLEAKGCRNCTIGVAGVDTDDPGSFSKSIRLRNGKGKVAVPQRFTSVQLEVTTKGGWSGDGAAALIVPQYKFYAPGERITNDASRYSEKGRICFGNTEPEWRVSFRVHRDPGDPKPRPSRKKDPGGHDCWTPFIVRAWASPTVQGVGDWTPVFNGRAGTQNTVCGLPGLRLGD